MWTGVDHAHPSWVSRSLPSPSPDCSGVCSVAEINGGLLNALTSGVGLGASVLLGFYIVFLVWTFVNILIRKSDD